MSGTVNEKRRKVSEDVHSIGKNIFLDSATSPIRRSIMESERNSGSYGSGRGRSKSSSAINVIEENKEMDFIRSTTFENAYSANSKAQESGEGTRFDKRSSMQKNTTYTHSNRTITSQDTYGSKTNIPNIGMTNHGFVNTSQPSLNRDSMRSIPIYREQYCFTKKWSRLEKILLLIIFILSFIIVSLISFIGFTTKQSDLKNCDRLPAYFSKICEEIYRVNS